jgi:very-short-patch-repair endonuclease
LRRLITAARLPKPRTNVRVAGWEVDVLWPRERLIVEVDGYAYHGNRAAFERDRRKDAALTAAGYTVIRITWRQLKDEPLAVVALLARLIRPG